MTCSGPSSSPKSTKIVDLKSSLRHPVLGGIHMHDALTTEALRKKFKNNFDLCNFAINIGRNMILGGSQATLTEILAEVDRQS